MLQVMGETQISVPRDPLHLSPCAPLFSASLDYNMGITYTHYNVGDSVAIPRPQKKPTVIHCLLDF